MTLPRLLSVLCLMTLLCAALLTGCSTPIPPTPTETPASSTAAAPAQTDAVTPAGDGLRIVASFYPIYLHVLHVIQGTNAQVSLLAPPQTGCLHDYQFTTQDMATLEKADILVINGGGMEHFTDRAACDILNASEQIPLLSEAVGDDDPHPGERNAHVWVDPDLAAQQVRAIAQGLGALDADNAAAFAANADDYAVQLEAVAVELRQAFAAIGNVPVITFHEAFAYWAPMGMDVVAVMAAEPDVPPTASDIANLIDIARSEHVRALFAEPGYGSDVADTIARETNIPVYALDPLSAPVGDLDDLNAYITGMRANITILQEALAGGT